MSELLTVQALYLAGIAVFVLSTAVTGVIAATRPTARRSVYALLMLAQVSMAIGYVGMHQSWLTVATGGGENSVFRFFGYHMAFLVLAYLFTVLLEIERWRGAMIAVVLNLFPGATLLSWIATGATEQLLTGVIVGSITVFLYVFFRPLDVTSRNVNSRQRLVFTKLRNFSVLCIAGLVLLAALSEQNMGVTTAFSGQVGATYLDVIFVTGLSYLATSEQDVY